MSSSASCRGSIVQRVSAFAVGMDPRDKPEDDNDGRASNPCPAAGSRNASRRARQRSVAGDQEKTEPCNSGARWIFSEIDMEDHMGGNLIYYAIVFLIVAIVAAALGFGGVAGTAISGAH